MEEEVKHWSQGLFDKPIKRIICGFEGDESYSFDITDLVLVEKKWYLVTTRGCSCPSYEEMARIDFGPATLRQIKKHVIEEYPQDYYTNVRNDVLEAIEKELKGL